MDEKALINVLSGLFDEKLQPVHNRLDRLEGRLDGMDSRPRQSGKANRSPRRKASKAALIKTHPIK